jgi:hypothetical protein
MKLFLRGPVIVKAAHLAAACLNGSDIFLSELFERWTLFNRITTTVQCFCLSLFY